MTSRLHRNFNRCKAKALSTITLQVNVRRDLTLKQTESRVHDFAALSLTGNLLPSRQNIAKTAERRIQISRNAEELQISAIIFLT